MSGSAPGLGTLLVVTGPTASGKTALAVALAKALDGELVGADSVQVYRGFDVGAAKPSPRDLDGIPHHMLDVADPGAPLDAATFARLADEVISGVRARNKTPIVVGGSGLWLRALLRGLVPLPPVDPELRASLTARAEQLGDASLHAELTTLDPTAAANIHPNDRLRVVRALEVHAQTGKPLGELRAEHALGAPRYAALRILLDPGAQELQARIGARTDAMLESGLIEETKSLLAKHGEGCRPLGSVGYLQARAHIRGEATLGQTAIDIQRATRIYGRRQRTWLRSEPGDNWCVESAEPILCEAGLARLRTHLDGPGGRDL